MDYKKDYKTEKKKLTISKDMATKILNILKSPSSKVLTSSDLQTELRNFNLKDILILSKKMEDALDYVKDRIASISQSAAASNQACLFYTTDFGGSKTQFIYLVLEEIQNEWKNDRAINVVPIFFENLGQIGVDVLKRQMLAIVLKTLSELLDTEKELHIYNKILELSAKAEISARAHSMIVSTKKLLKDIPHKNIPSVLEILDMLPIYDDERLFEFLAELMIIASQKGITFLFCFDEMDGWVLEDASNFKLEFYKRQNFLTKLFDLGSKIKVFFLFTITERVINLLKTLQKSDPRSAAVSRLSSFLTDAIPGRIGSDSFSVLIREDGKYFEDDAETAILRFIRLFEIAQRFSIVDLIFDNLIEPIYNQINGILLRRYANTRIISILETYSQVIPFLSEGFKKLGLPSSYAAGIGTDMQEVLTLLLRHLGYTYQLKHYDLKTGKKIDGMLRQDGEVFYGEIKYITSIDKLTIEKLKQVYDSANITKERTFFFCCGEGMTEEDVLSVLKKAYSLRLFEYKKEVCDLIHPICINERLLLAAMIGAIKQSYEEETMGIVAKWCELVSKLPTKLFKAFPPVIPPKPEEKEGPPTEVEPIAEPLPPIKPTPTPAITGTDDLDSLPHLTAIEIIKKMRKSSGQFQWSMVSRKMKDENIPPSIPLHRYIDPALEILHSLGIIKSKWKTRIELHLTPRQKNECKLNPQHYLNKWIDLVKANAI